MTIDVHIPALGESVSEVIIGRWLKQAGDAVAMDETLVVLETDKAAVELPAPVAGTLAKIVMEEGQTAKVGDLVAVVDPAGNAEAKSGASKKQAAPDRPAAPAKPAAPTKPAAEAKAAESKASPAAAPSARRLIAEHELKPTAIEASGRGGRIVKDDVVRHLARTETPDGAAAAPASAAPASTPAAGGGRLERVVPMTPLRKRIAKRLVAAQREAALLTTFNEIDMSEVKALRAELQDAFTKKHGTKLGFMSFFVKAVIEALKDVPQLNAEVRGEDIIFKDWFDIGVAVGSGRGLVVPVLRDADRLGFADIERQIADFATRAQSGKLEPDELQGGTFTISNGGVYGSLLSTPIVNPPQSGVLGMHAIVERPIGKAGQVVLAPMMYVALTYDHRLVDGREAVTFLRRIKDTVERPARLLLEV